MAKVVKPQNSDPGTSCSGRKSPPERIRSTHHFEHQLDEEKDKLKETPKRISWAQMAEKDRFHRLLPGRRRLIDTIRMIAYRAETAMASLLVDNG
jgi:hypothetical protein